MSGQASDTTATGLEDTIGRVLTMGVATSSLCLAVGLILTLAGIGSGFAHTLLTIGILVLLATPSSRVLVSAISYTRARDWLFVVLTLVVLLELAASVLAAILAARVASA